MGSKKRSMESVPEQKDQTNPLSEGVRQHDLPIESARYLLKIDRS